MESEWEGWREVAAERPAPDVVRYRTSQGPPWENSIAEILLNVSHHSATYRGQVVPLLRSQGLPPVSGDMRGASVYRYLKRPEGRTRARRGESRRPRTSVWGKA
jgi:hypothetical protein